MGKTFQHVFRMYNIKVKYSFTADKHAYTATSQIKVVLDLIFCVRFPELKQNETENKSDNHPTLY